MDCVSASMMKSISQFNNELLKSVLMGPTFEPIAAKTLMLTLKTKINIQTEINRDILSRTDMK